MWMSCLYAQAKRRIWLDTSPSRLSRCPHLVLFFSHGLTLVRHISDPVLLHLDQTLTGH